MTDEKIKAIVVKRSRYQDEDYYGIEGCWMELVEIMREDMDGSLDYLLNRCTANDLAWIGDSFEYVARELESEAFLECIRALAEKQPVINEYGFLAFINEC